MSLSSSYPPFLRVFFSILFCLPLLLTAQEQPAIQHHIGLELSFGGTGALTAPNAYYGNPVEIWSQEHYRGAMSYHSFYLEGQLHLGVGLGFQHKRVADVYIYQDSNGDNRYTSILRIQRDLILPIQVGYQSQFGGKHHLTADLLLTPLYLVERRSKPINQNFFPAEPPNSPARLGLETGLQLGYSLDLSDKVSLQLAVLGTVEPFARDFLDRQHYTLGLNAGWRYQL